LSSPLLGFNHTISLQRKKCIYITLSACDFQLVSAAIRIHDKYTNIGKFIRRKKQAANRRAYEEMRKEEKKRGGSILIKNV
jgi:hypothetical protein